MKQRCASWAGVGIFVFAVRIAIAGESPGEWSVALTKDIMSLEDYYRLELHLQSTSIKVLKPARDFALKTLK